MDKFHSGSIQEEEELNGNGKKDTDSVLFGNLWKNMEIINHKCGFSSHIEKCGCQWQNLLNMFIYYFFVSFFE